MRKVLFLAVLAMFGCGEYGDLGRVYLQDSHTHVVEVSHSHEFDVLDHGHPDNELFPQSAPVVDPVVEVTNPFSDILLASDRVLAMDGGRELLRIALLPVKDGEKFRMFLAMPQSEARALLLEAYLSNEAIVKRIESEVEALR